MGCCRCGGKKEELSVERDKCGGVGGRRAGGSVAWSC